MVSPPPEMEPPLLVQLSVPPLAMVTGGVAFTEVPARLMLMVSLPAGTPGGDQFPGSCQLLSTRPVQALVAACAAVVPDSSTAANSARDARRIRPKRGETGWGVILMGKRRALASL